MNWSQYNEQLTQNVRKISSKEKLQFAIEICDKLLPDYQSFVKKYKWGTIKALENGLAFCKDFSNGNGSRSDLIEKLLIGIEKNQPDTDDYGQVLGSLALNSACVIIETLNFIRDRKNDRIVGIGNLCYDSEFFKISEKKPNLSDLELEKEKELQNEMEWQLEKTRRAIR